MLGVIGGGRAQFSFPGPHGGTITLGYNLTPTDPNSFVSTGLIHSNAYNGWSSIEGFAAPSALPALHVNTLGAPNSVPGFFTVATDQIYMHAGNPVGDPVIAPFSAAVLRYTVPITGIYDITGSFDSIDTGIAAVDILRNGTSILSSGAGSDATPFSELGVSLSAGDSLDFVVGDSNGNVFSDSTGLYANVVLRSVISSGLPHDPIGVATLGASGGVLTVSNLGSSGNDGVAASTGSLVFVPGHGAIGYSTGLSYAGVVPPAGATLVTTLLGTRASVPNQTLGTITVGLNPTGIHTLGTDFSGLAAGLYRVDLYRGATLVHHSAGHPGTGIVYNADQSCPPEPGSVGVLALGDPIPGVDVTLEQNPGGIVKAEFDECVPVDLGDGAGVQFGDRLVFEFDCDYYSAYALTAVHTTSNLPSFTMEGEALRVFDLLHEARGSALIAGNPAEGLLVTNIGSSGADGVNIRVEGGAAALHVDFGGNGFAATDAGASLATRAVGTVAGIPGTTLLTLTQTATASEVQIAAIFPGETVETIIVVDKNAGIVFQGEVPNGLVVGEQLFIPGDPIPEVDISLERPGGGILKVGLSHPTPREFDVDGVFYTGDRLTFQSAFDTTTAVLDDVELLAVNPGGTNLEALEIVHEIVTPLPEPSATLMLASGAGGLAMLARWRRRAR